MPNPWLKIPANEYEAHMSSAEVGQLQVLNKIFKDTLDKFEPRSIAVLGCCTGNGFEHIDPNITKKVIGIDINPEYLSIVKERYRSFIPDLELIEIDLSTDELSFPPVDLIFGSLIFEYVNVENVLSKIKKVLDHNGKLIVCLQMKSESCPGVTPSKFKSLERLSDILHLIEPDEFREMALKHGFQEIENYEVPLKQGKRYYTAYYQI
jgi:SAM-dependent methyltransferase